MKLSFLYSTVVISIFLVTVVFVPSVNAGTDDSNEKEVGIEYANHDISAESDAEGFYNVLGNEGFTQSFNYGDYESRAAHESDYEKQGVGGEDYNYVDDVDFNYFSGHGNPNGFSFNINSDGDSNYTSFLHYSEAEWGDNDLEWIFISACKVLKYETREHWNDAFNSPPWLHGMTGFHTNEPVTSILGEKFAKYLTDSSWGGPYSIKNAWKKATIDAISGSYEAAIYAVELNPSGGVYVYYWDEYLPGYGSGMLSDPGGGSPCYDKWSCD